MPGNYGGGHHKRRGHQSTELGAAGSSGSRDNRRRNYSTQRVGWGAATPNMERTESHRGLDSGNVRDRTAERPPPGLRGREIGLWYAKRSKERKQDSEGQEQRVKQLPQYRGYEINIGEDVQSTIRKVLNILNRNSESFRHSVPNPSSSVNHEFRQDYMSNLVGNLEADGSPESEITTQLVRNEILDSTLQKELEEKVKSVPYNAMLQYRQKLPAYSLMKEVTDVIHANQVTVISGETGSGKTTQIPQFILDRCITDGDGSLCNIICTQPRRISTISVAERVAEERGEQVGENSIGYSIRLEKRLPKRTGGTLTFLVTGVLLQRLRLDPFLRGISHVIVDEVHERDNLSDFILAILKDLVRKRPDLKVILMSATLNAEKFSEYFGGCAIFHIPGVTFPVTQHYLEDVLERTKFVFPIDYKRQKSRRRYISPEEQEFQQLVLPWISKLQREKKYPTSVLNELRKLESEELNLELIQATLEHIASIDNSKGAVLIFVTGWDHISKLIKQFESCGKFPSNQFLFYPLHSLIPTATQKEIFKRPPQGVRKVIIATNIAETSITIDDVLFVIDCGKIKQTNFDIKLNLQTLDNEWVSRANAQQRRGRAGRVRAGVCFHLYSRGRERLLEDFKLPEIRRMKLEEPVLKIKNLRYGNAAAFFKRFLDPPEEIAVTMAVERLHKIGALDSLEQLTPLGFHLSKLPMDPYTGKMILMAAIFSCVDPILSCAASLSVKDCFQIPMGREREVDEVRLYFSDGTRSDHIAVIKAIEGYEEAKSQRREGSYCYRNFISFGTMKHLLGVKHEFAQYLQGMAFLKTPDFKHPSVNRNSGNTALIKAIICAGLYPNLGIAKTRNVKKSGKTIVLSAYTHEDGKVKIHPKSVNSKPSEGEFGSPFLLYFQKMKSSAIFLHDTTMVTPFPLIFFGGELDYIEDSGYGSLGVDGLTRFRCSASIYEMIQALRQKLDEILEEKIQNPGPSDWEEKYSEDHCTSEGLLLRAIRDLLTAEYHNTLTDCEGEHEPEDSEDEDGLSEV